MTTNWYSVFYWLTVADGIKQVFNTFSNIFTLLTVIFLIGYIIIMASYLEAKKQEEKIAILVWKKTIGRALWTFQIIAIITWIGWVAVPTKKDCMLIVAGGAVGNFITTDTSAKALPSDVTRFLHLSLNKELNELSSEVKTEIKKGLDVPSPKNEFLDKLKGLTKEEIINRIKTDTTIIK